LFVLQKKILEDKQNFYGIKTKGDEYMEIKCILKELLEERGMKQQFIVDKTGITNGTLSMIVRGKSLPTLKVAYKIADVIGKRVDEIWIPIKKV
jgi:putative transcriptional regulator